MNGEAMPWGNGKVPVYEGEGVGAAGSFLRCSASYASTRALGVPAIAFCL